MARRPRLAHLDRGSAAARPSRALAIVWSSLAIWSASGCDERNYDLALHAYTPVAVGATSGAVVVDVCQSSSKDDFNCSTDHPRATSATVDDPAVFAVEVTASGGVRMHALAEGSTILRVEGETAFAHESLSTPVGARRANQVTLTAPTGCESPFGYGTDFDLDLPFELLVDGQHLYGYGLHPFSSPVAAVDESLSSDREVTLHTASSPGSGAIVSSVDATVSVPLLVYGVADVEAIALSDPSPFTLAPLGDIYVRADAIVAGRKACGDAFLRDVHVETPDTCKLNCYYSFEVDHQIYGPGPLVLRGIANGTCTFSVSLAGTGLVATGSLPVGR